MEEVEKDITNKFRSFREARSKEMYFYNPHWFNEYVKFIKSHKLFVREKEITKQSYLLRCNGFTEFTQSIKQYGYIKDLR